LGELLPSKIKLHGERTVNLITGKIDSRWFIEYEGIAHIGGDTEDSYLKLSKIYFKSNHYLHAIGAAQLGLVQYPNNKSFKTVLGCSLTKIGFMEEGYFHLKNSGETCASL
jgi:hypothetical protein